MHRSPCRGGGTAALSYGGNQYPCQVPNGTNKNQMVATFIVEPGGVYAGNYFSNSQTRHFLRGEFLASLLGCVPHIEANGDSFLGSPANLASSRSKAFFRPEARANYDSI